MPRFEVEVLNRLVDPCQQQDELWIGRPLLFS